MRIKGPSRRVWAVLLGIVCSFSTSHASAAAFPDARTEACLVQAAQRHGVDPWLLAAVARTESAFNPMAVNRNGNGTEDFGLMQINGIWGRELARYGISRQSMADPCVSAHVGAWILSGYIRTHGDVWKGVSAYNTGSPSRGMGYAAKVKANRDALIAEISARRRPR